MSDIRYAVSQERVEGLLDGMTRDQVIDETLEDHSEAELEAARLLDDIYGEFDIYSTRVSASEAMRNVDPVAWDTWCADVIHEVDLDDYPEDEEEDDEEGDEEETHYQVNLYNVGDIIATRFGNVLQRQADGLFHCLNTSEVTPHPDEYVLQCITDGHSRLIVDAKRGIVQW